MRRERDTVQIPERASSEERRREEKVKKGQERGRDCKQRVVNKLRGMKVSCKSKEKASTERAYSESELEG